jgi:hypothetical protein
LRGRAENYGFVVKGLSHGLFGSERPVPIGVAPASQIEALLPSRWAHWQTVEAAWRHNYGRYLQFVRLCAEAPAAHSAVVALVENGLWEARQWLPVVMMAEGLWDPYRDPDQLVALLERLPGVTALATAAHLSVRHLAVGKAYAVAEPPAARYSDAGQKLTDGRVGPAYALAPEWCGWEGAPVTVTVDLGAPQTLTQVGAHLLRSQAWGIFLPKALRVWVSADGVSWREVGELAAADPAAAAPDAVQELLVPLPPGTVGRWVRLQLDSIGPCPPWHSAAGRPSWLFLSEIVVR